MPTRILGIDPGINGACAIYSVDARAWMVIDLPTVGEGSQRRINAPALRDWLGKYAVHRAFIESVAAFPGQGVSSMFRFGRAVGAIESVVAVASIPITYVVPQQWKRFYGLRGSDKEQSRSMAVQRFPSLATHLARVMDHGRAEAALIAFFGAAVAGAVASMAPLDNPRATGTE